LSRHLYRLTLIALFVLASVLCSAGTLTVTSPTNNSYISPTTSVTYNIAGAVVQVTVTVTTTFPNGSTSTSSQQVLPNSDGDASGTIAANISSSSPQGVYTIVVTATEPNNSYSPTKLSVTLLPLAPQFSAFSPPDGTFENGNVPIRASINDSYLQLWTVQVNGQNIPNNTGTTNHVSVDWNTSGVLKDGQQTITITATDLANQTTTVTMTITLSRVPPIITIEYPGTGTVVLPGSDIDVTLSIQGEFANEIDKTGVDVLVMTSTNAYVTRVPFGSLFTSSSNGNAMIWTGRIRYAPGRLPGAFQLKVSAVDKAGNVATPQTQIVTIGH
jgi:hypothetical protein